MFVVIELQKVNGQILNVVNAYESKNEAESKFHSILSAAATSSVDVHSAIMVDERGLPLRHEHYIHSTPEA